MLCKISKMHLRMPLKVLKKDENFMKSLEIHVPFLSGNPVVIYFVNNAVKSRFHTIACCTANLLCNPSLLFCFCWLWVENEHCRSICCVSIDSGPVLIFIHSFSMSVLTIIHESACLFMHACALC